VVFPNCKHTVLASSNHVKTAQNQTTWLGCAVDAVDIITLRPSLICEQHTACSEIANTSCESSFKHLGGINILTRYVLFSNSHAFSGVVYRIFLPLLFIGDRCQLSLYLDQTSCPICYGDLNIRHQKWMIHNNSLTCYNFVTKMQRLCFLHCIPKNM